MFFENDLSFPENLKANISIIMSKLSLIKSNNLSEIFNNYASHEGLLDLYALNYALKDLDISIGYIETRILMLQYCSNRRGQLTFKDYQNLVNELCGGLEEEKSIHNTKETPKASKFLWCTSKKNSYRESGIPLLPSSKTRTEKSTSRNCDKGAIEKTSGTSKYINSYDDKAYRIVTLEEAFNLYAISGKIDADQLYLLLKALHCEIEFALCMTFIAEFSSCNNKKGLNFHDFQKLWYELYHNQSSNQKSIEKLPDPVHENAAFSGQDSICHKSEYFNRVKTEYQVAKNTGKTDYHNFDVKEKGRNHLYSKCTFVENCTRNNFKAFDEVAEAAAKNSYECKNCGKIYTD